MYSNGIGVSPNCQSYSTQQFFSIFFSQYCPKIFENKSYLQVFYKLSTGFRQESQEIIFIFFFGSPRYYFHFLFRFAQEFHFLFLSRFAQKNWPHNSSISNQFLTTFHLSFGFTICYNIVVPRERKKPCAVRLEPIGPKFRALVYI